MSWRDQIQKASFRGVEFNVSNSDRGGGRRVVRHEYPFKDVPYTEDMGRKGREFNVEAFVNGSEYIISRDQLLDQLEQQGPGTLVHPYYGTLRVACLDYKVRESSQDGGAAYFQITFCETSAEATQPTDAPDAAGAVKASAANASAAAIAGFLSQYNPGPIMASVTDAVLSAMAVASDAIAPLQMDAQAFASLQAAVTNIQTNVNSLIGVPQSLCDSLTGLISGFTDGTRDALLSLYNFTPGNRPPSTTVNRKLEQACFDATVALVKRLVVSQAAALVVGETFASFDEAQIARESITDLIDDQAETAADDTYPAMIQLRADVAKAVPGAASDLPRIISVKPPVTVPSLVLAYRLYGDVDSELALVARNGVSDPSMIAGGVALEVLSDD